MELPCPLRHGCIRANAAQCAFLLQGASDRLYSRLNICQRKTASGKEILRLRQVKRIISLGINWMEMWLRPGSDPVHACLQFVSQPTGRGAQCVPQFTHLSDQDRNGVFLSCSLVPAPAVLQPLTTPVASSNSASPLLQVSCHSDPGLSFVVMSWPGVGVRSTDVVLS